VLFEAHLCDLLKCWPEDLDGHDVMRLLRNQAALAFYRVAQKPMDQWTPEDRDMLKDLRNQQWEQKWHHEH